MILLDGSGGTISDKELYDECDDKPTGSFLVIAPLLEAE